MRLHDKRIFLSGTAFAALMLPMAASARTEIHPYIEAAQILTAELKGNPNEVLTYSSVAAGVEATMQGQRTQAQVSYRYERRIGWGEAIGDDDTHTGLARVSHQLISNKLTIEAGALASQTRSDIRGAAAGQTTGNPDNLTQVYSAYAGPTLSTQVGALSVGASYRLGYTKVEANDFVPIAGQPRLDSYDDSLSHVASASVGMAPDVLPFGWSVSGAYEREDAGQLDQRFESKGVRGEITFPISPTVALLGGVGYEDIQASQRSPLLDVGGNPLVDSRGRYVTDSASPRQIAYDFDGIYWDVGVAWKPSRRTNLEAYVGRRYGSMSYTGSLTWAPTSDSAFQIGVYDQVETFGQQVSDSLATIPTSFAVNRNPLGNQFGGCTFGNGASGAGSSNGGGCLNSAFQSANSSVFRSRGVSARYSASHGPLSYGVGVGYAQRTYKTPALASFNLNGVKDESYYGQGNVGYKFGQNSSIDTSVYASLYDSGIAGSPDVVSAGATSTYSRTFGQNLSATAAVGLYSFDIEGTNSELNASALLGMRYTF